MDDQFLPLSFARRKLLLPLMGLPLRMIMVSISNACFPRELRDSPREYNYYS